MGWILFYDGKGGIVGKGMIKEIELFLSSKLDQMNGLFRKIIDCYDYCLILNFFSKLSDYF